MKNELTYNRQLNISTNKYNERIKAEYIPSDFFKQSLDIHK